MSACFLSQGFKEHYLLGLAQVKILAAGTRHQMFLSAAWFILYSLETVSISIPMENSLMELVGNQTVNLFILSLRA